MKCASVKAAGVDCDDDGRKRDPERYAQIHSGGLDQYISNFGEVQETLSGHPVFAAYLGSARADSKTLEKHLARNWPSSMASHRKWRRPRFYGDGRARGLTACGLFWAAPTAMITACCSVAEPLCGRLRGPTRARAPTAPRRREGDERLEARGGARPRRDREAAAPRLTRRRRRAAGPSALNRRRRRRRRRRRPPAAAAFDDDARRLCLLRAHGVDQDPAVARVQRVHDVLPRAHVSPSIMSSGGAETLQAG